MTSWHGSPACPEMTQLVAVVGDFAQLLTPCAGNADALSRWIVQVRAVDLPHLHAFTRGLERDRDPVIAALTLPTCPRSWASVRG
jgi:hypothetical protein